MIIVTINGCIFDLAEETYRQTCLSLSEMYELTQDEEDELIKEGEVSTSTVYIEAYEE